MRELGSPSKPVVLIIEDDSVVAEVIQETLTSHGYAAKAYTDARTAISECRKWPELIHLVLTDASVLGKAGLQDLEKCVCNHPQMKVLLTSGRAYGKDIADLRRDMPHPCIAKP